METEIIQPQFNKADYYKSYYQKNKDKYREQNERRKSMFVTCDICHCEVGRKSAKAHLRTQKHIKYSQL